MNSIRAVLTLSLLPVLCAADGGHELAAQDRVVRLPRRLHWDHYHAHDVFSSRIYAEAALIRAQGDAAVSFAEARNLNAEAYNRELDNWVKEIRARWEREAEAEVGRMELDHVRQIARLKYINDRKWENHRTWERLKNLPELGQSRIESGDALNFLLARLEASALPYEYDAGSSRFGTGVVEQLQLNPEALSHITLRRGSYSFPASEEMQEDVLWPYLLRREEFHRAREAYETARRAVVQESVAGEQVSVETIERLHDALMELSNRFHRSTRVRNWVRENLRYSQFRASDRFLSQLDQEIVQLEKTGDLRPFRGRGGYDPATDGDHLLSLLCFMNRNGLEFGPAVPGSEFAYHDVFTQMRAIYLTVDDEDESIQPQNLRNLAE